MAAAPQLELEDGLDADTAAVGSDFALAPSLAVSINEPALTEVDPHHNVGAKVGRNVSVTLIARIGYMVTRVMIPPFVLAHIGLDAYGIWTTAFMLVAYLGLSTLGMSNVYIKYVAEYNARREYQKANELLSSGLILTLPLCGFLFACLYFGWNFFAPWLKIPAAYASDGKEAMLITTGVFLSSIALNAFSDVLTGVQEIAAAQWIWIISYLVEGLLIFVFISNGRGIRGLAEAYLARTVTNDVLSYIWMRRKLPWLKISPRFIRKDALKKVFHFGGLVQLQEVVTIVLNSIERVLALVFLGVGAAGLMDLAKKWPSSVQSVPCAFFGAMLPAASHVDARGPREARLNKLRELYLQGARYSNFLTAYFAGLMIALPAAILHVWLRQPLAHAATLFAVFTIWLQFHMLTGPGTSVLRGMGRVCDEFYYSLPNLVLLMVTIPAAYLLMGRHWSVLVLGIGVVSATVFSSLALLWRAHSVLELRWASWLEEAIVPGLLFYVVGAALAWPVSHLVEQANRFTGASVLFAAGVLYTAVSFAALYKYALRTEERAKLLEKMFAWRNRVALA